MVMFEGNDVGPAVEVDVPEGGRLVDICDDSKAPVMFSCRGASCGTCRVEILEGINLLAAAKEDEREVLDIFAAPQNHRLACQACLDAGPGRVRVKWVEE